MEEVHQELTHAADRDMYDSVWQKIGQKLTGQLELQPRMETELGENYEHKLKQVQVETSPLRTVL